jgi:predicted HAD superfamily Cof-like phosphohydrolase
MHRVMEQLHDFHRAMGQTIGSPVEPDCTVDLALRVRLIAEEFEELLVALEPKLKPGIVEGVKHWLDAFELLQEKGEAAAPDVVEVADSLADILYVTAGAGVAWGILLAFVFDEVHRSNMAKSDGPVREDGKRLKPPGWTPPDVAGVIDRGKLGVYALVEARKKALAAAQSSGDYRSAEDADRAWDQVEAIDRRLKELGFDSKGNKL